jgi:hypothetical protein
LPLQEPLESRKHWIEGTMVWYGEQRNTRLVTSVRST